MEEVEEPKPRTKGKTKEVVPPIKEVMRDVVKRGKDETQTFYIYPVIVPRGAFLVDLDPSASGDKGIWIKLWRDVLWSIFRSRSAQRKPFEDRAEGKQVKDAAKAWVDLLQSSDYSIELPSTYFIGAQEVNAENVPFKDRSRWAQIAVGGERA